MRRRYWQDWGVLATAAWLFVSPFFLGFHAVSHPGSWVAWSTSVLLLLSGTGYSLTPDSWTEWGDAAVGGGLVATPWLFGFDDDAVPSVSFVIAGLIVTLCAISAAIRLQMGDKHWSEPHGGEL